MYAHIILNFIFSCISIFCTLYSRRLYSEHILHIMTCYMYNMHRSRGRDEADKTKQVDKHRENKPHKHHPICSERLPSASIHALNEQGVRKYTLVRDSALAGVWLCGFMMCVCV